MALGKLLPDHRVCHERPVQCVRERERQRGQMHRQNGRNQW
jgi:hypothetical protein